MARSKNRVLDIDQENFGEYITAQIELDNGEVVIAGFQRSRWHRAPAEVNQDMMKRMSNGPVGTFGKLKAPDQ